MSSRVLVVEDDAAMGALAVKVLSLRGMSAQATRTARDALTLLESADFDAVVTDINMPGMTGLEFCQQVSLNRADLPVIVMTAFGSLDSAVAAMRAGAYDFVSKPVRDEVLVLTVERAVEHRRLREELKRLRTPSPHTSGDDDFVGESPALKKAFSLIERVADSETTVLVTGESGTGKEVVARKIHEASRRRAGPFVAVNCAALPEHLLDSELFGHVGGAFTDAKTSRTGLFRKAEGGTIFLDEIGELPLSLQPKLLRALQERKVRPVGGDAEVPFDARIVTATNKDLEEEVEAGHFRQDLLFRINVVVVDLPPLRMRGNDILLLAQRFLTRFAARSGRAVRGLSAGAAQKLLRYRWPGNVRELQNCMERAVALAAFEELTVDDLPAAVTASPPAARLTDDTQASEEYVTLAENERRYIARVLEAAGGNKSMAARILGVDRKTLWRKMDRQEAPEKPE